MRVNTTICLDPYKLLFKTYLHNLDDVVT